MILAKNGTTKREVKPESFDRNELRKVFEILQACFEVPVLGHLWVTALYNPQSCDSHQSEIFETEMKNVYVSRDFNASHQELSCTNNTENSQKIHESIEAATLRLIVNGSHTYQSQKEDCQNLLDLHFTDQSVFKFFDTFDFSDDFGSDHS